MTMSYVSSEGLAKCVTNHVGKLMVYPRDLSSVYHVFVVNATSANWLANVMMSPSVSMLD